MSKNNDQTIENIIRLMQSDDSVDAPPDSIQWAKNIFRARVAVQPKKSFSQKVLAVLQMDLSPNQAVFGERSASSAVRQMLFQAGDNSIDLRISKTKKGLNLQGQILGEGFANCTVKIADENSSFEVRANDLSEFNFTEIPSGKYNLTFTGENEITVEDLNLN